MTTAPELTCTPVIVWQEAEQGMPGRWTVWLDWVGVDRPRCHGISVGPKVALAARLARAIEAGVVFDPARPPEVKTDVDGHTYVEAHLRVIGKYLNADLRRLGF